MMRRRTLLRLAATGVLLLLCAILGFLGCVFTGTPFHAGDRQPYGD